MDESSKRADALQRIFKYIKNVLDKYLKGMDEFEELQTFMSNEKQLYDKEGRPTQEYQAWIRKVEEYCRKCPELELDKEHTEGQDKLTDDQQKIASTSKEYFDTIAILRDKYHSATDKEAWIKDYLGNDSEKIQFLDKLLEQEILKAKDSIDKGL